jgi:general secretion pathway protein G
MNWKNERGFTLIEMLLAVIIISTLAAIVVPRFAGRSDEAKVAAATTDVQASIASALDLYELDNGLYPTTEQGLDALRAAPTSPPVPKNWRGPYLRKKKALKDPWGEPYVYKSPGVHNEDYDLLSKGPDGVEGGADDITNWDAGEGEDD